MMIKVSIFHMEPFLHAVNGCEGPVNLISPNGQKVDIKSNTALQQDLRCEHRTGRNYMRLCLDIPGIKDYFSLVLHTIAEF